MSKATEVCPGCGGSGSGYCFYPQGGVPKRVTCGRCFGKGIVERKPMSSAGRRYLKQIVKFALAEHGRKPKARRG